MPDRRTFLATLGALAAGCALPGRAFVGRARRHPAAPGIQLYTVRAPAARDLERTLAALARIGYREVETAGYHGHSPVEVRRMLDANGLTAPAAHVSLGDVRDRWTGIAADGAVVGHRWLVVPWIDRADRTPEAVRRLAALLNERGRDAANHGMRVAYHNHDFELAGAGSAQDTLLHVLLQETDPALVDFELDVYWAVRAGRDPVALLRAYPGRFPLLHLKDAAGDAARTMVDLGAGTIDFAAVLEAANAAHAFVEHDNPRDPMDSAAVSHRALAALLQRTTHRQ